MYTALNQYHVVMEVAPKYWQTPEGLNYVYLPTANSGQVPLSAVTHFEAGTAPIAVNHQGQFPSVTVSFNLAPGMALSDARDEINKMKQDVGMPASIRGDFSGTLQAFTASLSTEPWLIAIALVAVYIVLGVLYESYIHPITILSTLPSAGLGAVLALMFCHTDLSIIALIGIILLIGIVKKNAILMIDFALDAERREGKSSRDAIFQACLLRFRPDPDDHDGRHARRHAARRGAGHRLGAAPAARNRHRRRPGRQPGVDPLHDAGRLSLSGPPRRLVEAAARKARARGRPRRLE